MDDEDGWMAGKRWDERKPLAHSGSRQMPEQGCVILYTCGLATKASMAQWFVVLLSLNMRLWVRLSVVHFLFINKSNEPGSESTGIGLRSGRNLMEFEFYLLGIRVVKVSERIRAEWVGMGRNMVGIWSEYGRNSSENGWLPCQS